MRCEAWGDSGEGFRFLTLMVQENSHRRYLAHSCDHTRALTAPIACGRLKAGSGFGHAAQ